MRHLVTIIIPTRDNLEMIQQVTEGILHKTRSPCEIIIVDNASSQPDVLAFLASIAREPNVRVLRMATNQFYWPAINAGIRSASPDCEYVLALNDDIVIQSAEWLERLIAAFEDRADVGYVGDFQRSLFFPPLGGYIDGYCAMFRRELFDRVGFFDEKWPFYWGFVDFQLRAYRSGYLGLDIKRPGDAKDRIEGIVVHLRGRTLESMRDAISDSRRDEILGSTWTPVKLLATNRYYVQAAEVGVATALKKAASRSKRAIRSLLARGVRRAA